MDIEQLKREDGINLFKKRGIKGEDDELGKLMEEYGGHALSLTLVASFLNDFYDGDAKRANEISFYDMKDEDNKALRILKAYDERLTQEQRVFLQIFSCFIRPIDDDAVREVFRKKIKVKRRVIFNESLISMPEFGFKQMIHHLEERRLIYKGDTHQLIRNYFKKGLDEEARIAINRRLYHYVGTLAPNEPKTLEEMQPLFEQVYHGCAAGLYDEVDDDVYWEKIYRREEYFLVKKLGAWEIDLSLARTFFPNNDLSKIPLVSEKSTQSFLLNEAGLALLNTGRPKEAEKPFLTAVWMLIEAKDWENASVGYQNLADLWFRRGELERAKEGAQKAIELAEKAGSERGIVNSKAYLAWILHLLGKDEEAKKEFQQADELQVKIDPDGDRLYSLPGVFYVDFLISTNRIDEALGLTQANLEICQGYNVINDISRYHRCLSAIERLKGNHKEAEAHLQTSLEIARNVGMPFLEIEALLELGRLWLDMERYEDAIREANQVLNLCERTGFKLYEPEAELILARAYLGQKNRDKAKEFAKSAYEKATKMGYHWPKTDAGQLLNRE